MKNKKVYGRVTGLFPVNGDSRRGVIIKHNNYPFYFTLSQAKKLAENLDKAIKFVENN